MTGTSEEERPAPRRRRSRPQPAETQTEAAPAEEAPPSSGWRIPPAAPAEGTEGWVDGTSAPGKGGQWVQPPHAGIRPPTPGGQPSPPGFARGAQFTPPPESWLAPSLGVKAPAAALPIAVSPPAPAESAGPPPGPSWLADIGAGLAFAIEVGVLLQFIGSILTGWSSHSFVGSALVSEVERSGRFRLLEVFSPASFEHAVILLVAVLLTVSVPTERPSVMRRPALAFAAFLGFYIAAGATLRAAALLTFLGTSAALALGTTLSCLAAVPVACGAIIWSALLLTRDERERKDA